jgi:nitroreductase
MSMHSHPVIDAILQRRSVKPKRLRAPGPDEAEIAQIAAAGLRAPDHAHLRPWRLLLIRDRERFANAFADAEREVRPDAEEKRLARAREKALEGPTVLALIARIQPDHAKVPAFEQWITVGAALGNMLLAGEAMGYASIILSGRKIETDALRHALDLAGGEQLAGFITLGTPSSPLPAADDPDPATVWSAWP